MAYKNKLAAFDASEVVMTWGATTFEGLADGTFITVEQVEDSFSDVAGADGEVVRSKSNDRRATITLTLLQSSQANAELSLAHNLDINSPNGDAVAPLRIFDKSSSTLVFAPTSWIVKNANVEYSKEASTREWVFRANSVDMQHGFNPAV